MVKPAKSAKPKAKPKPAKKAAKAKKATKPAKQVAKKATKPAKKAAKPKKATKKAAESERDEGNEEFWDVADPLIGEGLIVEGSIMSSRCVRAGKEFVGMPHHKGPGIVVKLPKARVAELIDAGTGQPFAPAGKVFSEWVLVEKHNQKQWRALLRESVAFVSK